MPSFNQAAAITLRILLFRAGPQDFPFSPELTRVVLALMLATAWLQSQLTLAPLAAAVHAGATIAVWALFTRALLQARGLLNRYPQTLNALFATTVVVTLLMLAPLSALAPYVEALAEYQEAMRQEPAPSAIPQPPPLPVLPAFAALLLSLWNFIVSAHIYRHALDVRPAMGAVATLVAALVTVTLASAVTAFVIR